MKMTMNTLFEIIKALSKSDLERITHFVMGIVSVNLLMTDRPECPHCQSSNVSENFSSYNGYIDGEFTF